MVYKNNISVEIGKGSKERVEEIRREKVVVVRMKSIDSYDRAIGDRRETGLMKFVTSIQHQ